MKLRGGWFTTPGLALATVLLALSPLLAGSGDVPAPGRLVLIKADGLPPDLMAALAMPDREDLWARLPYAAHLRKAFVAYKRRTGREIVLPNIRRYFYEDGVIFDNVYSHTLTLSAVSWAVIDTGQPSVVKGHGTFSRDNGYLRSHLDGLRDTYDAFAGGLGHGEYKSSATWKLDQAGISLLQDAFDPLRTWSGPQIFRRVHDRELLLEGGLNWLTAEADGFGGIAAGHLARLAKGLNYSQLNQRMNSYMTAKKLLETDLSGDHRFDYVSPMFTLMDHEQHVDPNPENLVYFLAKLDDALGEIFDAVERSPVREKTLVAMVSDHGSEIKPGQTSFSFQLTKEFREPLLGAHNVRTLLVENAFSSVSTPMPGYDWPRLYESKYSAYNKNGSKAGEKGFQTAFVDPFGNGRGAIHLRNNDINRLHLILLKLKEEPDAERFQILKRLFKENLERTLSWLGPDLALYEDYHAGAQDLAKNLSMKIDARSRDTAKRLSKEAQRDSAQIAALRNLMRVVFEPSESGIFFDDVFSSDFEIDHYIPKLYLGRANSIYQLSHYTLDLDDRLEWVETTEDHQGRPVPMNYFEVISSYRASNAPSNGIFNPFDLMSTAVPLEHGKRALQTRGYLSPRDELKNLVWIKSGHHNEPLKGGEALVAQTSDDRLMYLPVTDLQQGSDGIISFTVARDKDPLALLNDPGFNRLGSRFDWLTRLRPYREWLDVVRKTEYSIGPIIILDLFNDPVAETSDSESFSKYLVHFTNPELKRRYIQGVKRKFRNQNPDFVVWADELWNFDSKLRTSGGNHAGLRPIVTRSTFVLWGGDKIRLPRGTTVPSVQTTLDIAPTVLNLLGMLDDSNRALQSEGADYRHFFLPFPGHAVDLASAKVVKTIQPATGDPSGPTVSPRP